ncbi:MAG: Na/Pi cotransporter family protein, partial [Pseudobacteriovorax sp.]|nr:Na/Pi cotransporter family protein [Pseudobacteriovorax sp.]
MDTVHYWEFLAGLGLFLLAMQRLEVLLKAVAGESFKSFLSRHTNRVWKAILSGTLATAFLQSSSVVTLMLLALVGSGSLGLSNAIGVVLGSNLGTTFTGWIVALLGFKLKFSAFVIPGLAIGALGRVFFTEGGRWHRYSQLIFVGALLFWGLDSMKNSVAEVTEVIDISILKGYPLLVYFAFGFLATALIQSSSAMMMITLTALNSSIIDFEPAAALVIGADLGTTITAALGSVKGNVNAKRVALAHFLYNLCVDLVALAALIPLVELVKLLSDDPLTNLVLFHSSFNLLGILVLSLKKSHFPPKNLYNFWRTFHMAKRKK